MGVADEIEVLDFLKVSHELDIALVEYLDYFSECVKEDVNLDWEA